MKTLRRILSYFFILIYLALCPLIIFYAFGYIFTPKTEEGFVKTGLIHVETLPVNASISISKRRYIEKTPATIRNLLAGSYEVKLSLSGYRPWVRNVKVESGKAANFDKVLFVPQSLEPRMLIDMPFEALWPVPGTRYLLLRGSVRVGDLKVFDRKSETVRPVLPEGSSYQDVELVKIFTAKESSWVLLQVRSLHGMEFLGCPLDKDKPEVKDLSRLFTQGELNEIAWEGDRPDYLFALYGHALSRLDLKKMTVLSGFLEKIRGFGLFKDKVYALRGASIVSLDLNAKKGDESVVEKGVFLENLFRGEERFKIDFISNHVICFWGEHGELFSNALPYRFVDEGVKGYWAGEEGRKVVLWQKERVGALDFEKPERKNEFFERGPEIEWVFETGKDIREAYFVYDAAYVLFCDGKEVFLAELGAAGVPPEKLVDVKDGSDVFYSEKTGKLYYLEPLRGGLVAVNILPKEISFSGVISDIEKETQGAVK